MPTLIVEAGFGSTMFTASPSWTAITDYVKRITVDRGRSAVDGRFSTGKATLLLDNTDGRFTPDNTSGAYSPNVITGVPIRIRATFSMTTYPVFYGSVRAWPPVKEGPNYTTVTVPLADGFYTLGLEDLAGESYSAESTDSRIGSVLDDLGWPAGLRDLDSGVADVQATDFAQPNTGGDQPALLHLLDVAESEAGVLFMSRDGKVTFDNRVAQSGVGTPSVTFDGDDFDKIKLDYSERYFWNMVRISREDGAQVEVDNRSGSEPRKVLTKDVMPMANDAEALNVAEWLAAVFGTQKLRVEELHFHTLKRSNAFTADILGLELRDSVTVQHTPTGGDAIDQDVAIEKIKHRITALDWQTTLEVTPLTTTETQDYWILGTSQLDTETRLA